MGGNPPIFPILTPKILIKSSLKIFGGLGLGLGLGLERGADVHPPQNFFSGGSIPDQSDPENFIFELRFKIRNSVFEIRPPKFINGTRP